MVDKKRTQKRFYQRLSLFIVVCATLLVLVDLVVGMYFSPQKVAERKIHEMAKYYYEEYFYAQAVGDSEPEKALAQYTESGFATTTLRQLLLFDGKKFGEFEKYFSYEGGYSCDRIGTYVQYYPEAPYGKTDYHVEYVFSCQES